MGRIAFSGLLNNGKTDYPIIAEGVEPERENVLGTHLRVVAGRMLTDSDTAWLKSNAEFRLMQLDAMDVLDRLNALAQRYADREGRVAQSWQTLGPALGLRGVPVDPTGVPFVINPTTGRISLGSESRLLPLPDEPPPPPALPARPVP